MMNISNIKTFTRSICKDNKTLIVFIIKALLIYTILYICFLGYVGLVDSKGGYHSPFLAKYSLIQLILDSLIYPSKFIINFLGFETITNSNTLWLQNGPGVLIDFPCLGVGMMITWLSLIAAYPNGKHKLITIILGLASIHTLNIVRIISLVFIQKHYANHNINHHDIFNYVVYSLIMIMFYVWINFSDKRKTSVA
jgi:exosortase/archaeosortase family protein